jgi:hypothetical protein
MLVLSIVAQLAVAVPSRLPLADSSAGAPSINVVTDTVRRRPRAITYSDAYATRLKIHRIGSYTMLPLFGAEFGLGQTLLTSSNPASWVKPTHTAVALGIGALFTVNTVTGAWNLWESRQDPAGRTRRWIHAALLIASDAGFVATGVIAEDAGHSTSGGQRHRNVALGSMALATAGTVMMWFWKD